MMVDCIFPTSENKIFPPYFGIFDAVLCIFSFAYDGISRLIEFTLVLEMFEIDNHDGLLFYFLIAVESGKTCFQFKRLIFFPWETRNRLGIRSRVKERKVQYGSSRRIFRYLSIWIWNSGGAVEDLTMDNTTRTPFSEWWAWLEMSLVSWQLYYDEQPKSWKVILLHTTGPVP